jgi:hypothetical protein
MTSNLDIRPHDSNGDRQRARAYAVEFGLAMAGYVVVLALVIAHGNLDGDSPWRFLWAVLPVVPALAMLRAATRHYQRVDEFQRGLLLQGTAVGFAGACIAAVTLGLLGAAGLDLAGSTAWLIYGAGMVSWGVASLVISRRAG